MNFATFQAVGGSGGHFVTTSGGQIPVAKLQQNVANNGNLQQMVSMVGGVEGVQYVRTLEGGAALHSTPHLISVPIALPGAKPGDPQPTVQIQVLSPNMLQQQPKYQMQIPIQGFQQGSAVLTLAYSPDSNETGGIQLLGNSLPEGVQVVAIPPEMQLMQPSQTHVQDSKEQVQHQVYITPNQQIVINATDDNKLNNNTSNNNNNMGDDLTNIVIKEECEEMLNDDESSQGTESSDVASWTSSNNHADLIKYLNTLTPQQAQALPASLQQFLRLNTTEARKEAAVMDVDSADDKKGIMAEAVMVEDGTVCILQTKKKKKYKKKPPKPARPKPGQVVIATAADGTPVFCCPECQMAYPEKEQLEMHLIVHKIERRFICGICGAGLKRKEHLERHKLGHNPERPYVCAVCRKGFKRREHLNLHAVIHSGVKTELCGECGKGFYRKDHLRKHTRSHETKRAKDEAAAGVAARLAPAPAAASSQAVANSQTIAISQGTADEDIKPVLHTSLGNNIMPEITIHVPTSANMQVPVQINIPPHIMNSLQAQAQASQDAQSQLDALLAQHS